MIKQKQNATPPPAAPGWGSIAEVTQRYPSLRFEWPNRSISFPYSSIARWEWTHGDPEQLTILARKDSITIRGRLLAPLRDALDTGKLQLVRQQGSRHAAVSTCTWIESLTLAAVKSDQPALPSP